ncbi:MAG: MBL fold metallo-hydrolase [Desulfobacterales bacterium]|nr:MBL fold metallo-hydrolase [Desulfobacterales bacterium]
MEPDYNVAVCVLSSGSKGNAIYVSGGSTSILIDAGLSGIEIERRLALKEIQPGSLDAIIVSHEHSDHIQGVGVLSRRFDLPVYISKKTEVAANHMGSVKDFKNFECGCSFQIKDLLLHPFSVSHDAQDPAGFTIGQNGVKIGIATDLGHSTSVVREHLKDCSLLVLESNHDIDMLIDGHYPWQIKQRIRSRTGHLSNESTKKLLMEILHDKLEYVVLSHLSEVNNTPEKALSVIGQAITKSKAKLSVARQDVSTEIYYI